jgi:uncharacterized protein (DUF2384 family)
MSTSISRTSVGAGNFNREHHSSVTEPIESVVKFLVDLLGSKLTAYVVSVDVSTISRWSTGKATPSVEAERKLRATYQIARLLITADADHTARAWFIGMNPQLDDESPIDVIVSGNAKAALLAARSFIASA